ncbi:MAG: glutathione S-transferase family protein [Myxococcota bacterium]
MRLSDKSLFLSELVARRARHDITGMNTQQIPSIELFTFGSTNGHKVAIALEELGFDYQVHTVNVFSGEGRTREFLAINPAGKIPVLRDRDADLVLTESDAILLYLADKAGRLVPSSGRERMRAIELLFLQASLQGPMFGQRMHFSLFSAEAVPYGIRRYEEQCGIIDNLVDQLLSGRSYFLGAEYSIVDIAFFSWYFASKAAGFDIEGHTNLKDWFERVSARPAVARGVTVPKPLPALPPRKVA